MLYDEIIKVRQTEIYNEISNIEEELCQLRTSIQKLEATKERRINEYNMLREVSDRGLIRDSTSTKTSRIHFEDAVKRIYNEAGRPLRIGDLIGKLEDYGYINSNYHTAYARIKAMHVLEPTGARGYYNLIR